MLRENVYIQYFLGFDSFTSKPPFDSYLFVEIRKRMGMEQLNKINDAIYHAAMGNRDVTEEKSDEVSNDDHDQEPMSILQYQLNNEPVVGNERSVVQPHHDRMLVDATACPQVIAYPTALGL